MLQNLCKWPDPKLHIGRVIAAIAVAISILVIGLHGFLTIRRGAVYNNLGEGFQEQDPNVAAYNKFRTDWGSAAVSSKAIQPAFFATYASILNIPAPTAASTETEYMTLVESTANAIKLWYVNARYSGNLAQLAVAIDASRPKFIKVESVSMSGSGIVIAAEVPPKNASDGLNKNLDYELNNFFQPTYDAYKELLDIGAQAYLTLPDPPPEPAEVRKLRESKYTLVEKQVLEESGGKTFPFVKLWTDISALKTGSGLNSTQMTIAIFNMLPRSVDTYTSTLSYLNKKAEMLAANVNNLQAPPGSGPDEQLMPVRGSLNDPTFKINSLSSESFIDMPDAQTMTESLRGRADKGLDSDISKLKSGNIDEQLAATYRVSQTRRRFLEEQRTTFETTLKNTKELYGRLKAMRDAVGSNASSPFGAIAGGASLDEALSTSAIETFFGGRSGFL